VAVRYPGAAAPALSGVSLCVSAGARVALVGSNGAGKSTFLKAAAGLVPLEAGTLSVLGHPAGWCRCRVAYLPQRPAVDWRFPADVEDFVLTGRDAHLGWFRRYSPSDRARAREALERVGLSSAAGQSLHRLSGGQQQRVLIARALAQEADLFLLDEPLNAVDAETRAAVGGLLKSLAAQGKTIVMATHHLGGPGEEADLAVHLSGGHAVPAPCEHPS
jgi:manganese/zinc/iron transport system ATP- binding protein